MWFSSGCKQLRKVWNKNWLHKNKKSGFLSEVYEMFPWTRGKEKKNNPHSQQKVKKNLLGGQVKRLAGKHVLVKIYFYFLPSCVSKVDSNRHVWWEITTAQQGICLCGSQWTWSLTSSLKWQQAGSYKLLWPVTPFTSGALTAEFLGHPHDGLCPLIPWNLYQVNRLHCLFADLEINPGH